MSDLYVMQSSYGHIKIGRSANAARRLRVIEQACGLSVRLLFIGPSAGETEFVLHEKLEPHRLKGEWFANNRATRAIINTFVGQELSFIERPVSHYSRAARNHAVKRILADGTLKTYYYIRRSRASVKDGETGNITQ